MAVVIDCGCCCGKGWWNGDMSCLFLIRCPHAKGVPRVSGGTGQERVKLHRPRKPRVTALPMGSPPTQPYHYRSTDISTVCGRAVAVAAVERGRWRTVRLQGCSHRCHWLPKPGCSSSSCVGRRHHHFWFKVRVRWRHLRDGFHGEDGRLVSRQHTRKQRPPRCQCSTLWRGSASLCRR